MDRQNRALSVRKGQSPFPRPSAPPANILPRAPPTPQDSSDEDAGQYRNNFNKSSSRYTTRRQDSSTSAFPNYYANDGPATTGNPRSQQRPPTPPRDVPQARSFPKAPQGPFQGTRRRQPSEPQPQARPRAGSQRQQQQSSQQQGQYYGGDAEYRNTSSTRVRDYSNISINIGSSGDFGPSISINGRDWRSDGHSSRDRNWDDDRNDGRSHVQHIHTPFISTPFGFGGDRQRAGFLNLGGFGIF